MTGIDKARAYAEVGRAMSGQGSQHAKVVHTDVGAVIGSTNLITSSRANNEVSVFVTFRHNTVASWRYRLSVCIAAGQQLHEAEKVDNIERYAPRRSRSVDVRRNSARYAAAVETFTSD